MKKDDLNNSKELVEHFFRNEYGKMVSVISKYLGIDQIATAEDLVQDTLLTAVDYWKHHGIPPNPQAWLYTTAKEEFLITINRSLIADIPMTNMLVAIVPITQ